MSHKSRVTGREFEQGRLFEIPLDTPSVQSNQNVLARAIENFMVHVELEPGDPGYTIGDDGFVSNVYTRTYTEERWGSDADIFELRYIERRMAELGEIFDCSGGYFEDLLTDKGLTVDSLGTVERNNG